MLAARHDDDDFSPNKSWFSNVKCLEIAGSCQVYLSVVSGMRYLGTGLSNPEFSLEC